MIPSGEQIPLITLQDIDYRPDDSVFQLKIRLLEVQRGEKVAIIGPSGSGKTTLLNLISGQLLAQNGTVEVSGVKVNQLDSKTRERFRLQHFGLIFQDFRLIDYLTVGENIQLKNYLPGKLRNQSFLSINVTVIADQLQLTDLLQKRPDKISQGERQRTAIGRAIFQQPEILLADEPTGNLDEQTARQTLDYLLLLTEQYQMTLLFVTHDHSLLSRFDRTIDMRELQ